MKSLVFSLLALCGLLSVPSANGTVSYRIDWTEPAHHLARFSVTLPRVAQYSWHGFFAHTPRLQRHTHLLKLL